MNAFANRGEQDDGGNADGDAEQRQETAQALGGDAHDGEVRSRRAAPVLHQGLHRIEAGGAAGRHDAEQQAGGERRAQPAITAQSGG